MKNNGGYYELCSGNASSGKIKAVETNWPKKRGGMYSHFTNLFLFLNAVITEGGTAASFILEDVIAAALSVGEVRLKSGKQLMAIDQMEAYLRVQNLLYQAFSYDDWDVAKSGTWTARVVIPLCLSNIPILDHPDQQYIYPFSQLELVEFALASTVSGFTLTTFDWKLVAQEIWLPSEQMSPIRTWKTAVGAQDKVELLAGKVQFAMIANPRTGSAANLYDSGISVNSYDMELKALDGRFINMDKAANFAAGPGTAMGDTIGTTMGELFQFLVCPSPYSLTKDDYAVGPVEFSHNSADPDVTGCIYLAIE
jgi:hypothetical protein